MRSRCSTCGSDDLQLGQADRRGGLGHAVGEAIGRVYTPEVLDHFPGPALADKPRPFGQRIVVGKDAAAHVRAHRFLGVEGKTLRQSPACRHSGPCSGRRPPGRRPRRPPGRGARRHR